MASARRHIENGLGRIALRLIDEADQAALQTGLSLDLSALRRQWWEAQFKSAINKVELYTSKGIPELTLLGIEEANATATKAELPLPDLSGVMQECWEKKLRNHSGGSEAICPAGLRYIDSFAYRESQRNSHERGSFSTRPQRCHTGMLEEETGSHGGESEFVCTARLRRTHSFPHRKGQRSSHECGSSSTRFQRSHTWMLEEETGSRHGESEDVRTARFGHGRPTLGRDCEWCGAEGRLSSAVLQWSHATIDTK